MAGSQGVQAGGQEFKERAAGGRGNQEVQSCTFFMVIFNIFAPQMICYHLQRPDGSLP